MHLLAAGQAYGKPFPRRRLKIQQIQRRIIADSGIPKSVDKCIAEQYPAGANRVIVEQVRRLIRLAAKQEDPASKKRLLDLARYNRALVRLAGFLESRSLRRSLS
jgi:hypothetical protein